MPFREGRAVLFAADGPHPRLQVSDSPKLPDGRLHGRGVRPARGRSTTTARSAAHRLALGRRQEAARAGRSASPARSRPSSRRRWCCSCAAQSGKGERDYEPLFSGLHIELNKPYFVAVSVKLSETGKAGVTFYAKDLSNDDEPMQSAHARAHRSPACRAARPADVRRRRAEVQPRLGRPDRRRADLADAALPAEQLLLTAEGVDDKTAGYWQFEPQPGVLKDASPNGLDISLARRAGQGPSARRAPAGADRSVPRAAERERVPVCGLRRAPPAPHCGPPPRRASTPLFDRLQTPAPRPASIPRRREFRARGTTPRW